MIGDIFPLFTVDRIYAFAALVTAITALVKLFLVDRKVASAKSTAEDTNARVTDTQTTVQNVQQQTNGQLATLQQQVKALEAHIKQLEDSGYTTPAASPQP